MARYSWITLLQARAALAARLADPNMVFWSAAELLLYLSEALRTWNALTEQWNVDFVFNPTSTAWYNFGTIASSPRMRTVTDAYLYTVMQYRVTQEIEQLISYQQRLTGQAGTVALPLASEKTGFISRL